MLPLCIDCLGTGVVGVCKIVSSGSGKLRLASTNYPSDGLVTLSLSPPPSPEEVAVGCSSSGSSSKHPKWVNYVLAPIVEYISMLPTGHSMDLSMAVGGDVPLGGGLSSSASLMVGIGKLLELSIVDCGFGDCLYEGADVSEWPALRARTAKSAENGDYVKSPCGIMDQFVISCGEEGGALWVKCGGEGGGEGGKILSSVSFGSMDAGQNVGQNAGQNVGQKSAPVLVVADCGVRHSIASGEYPKRVKECEEGRKRILGGDGGGRMLSDVEWGEVENFLVGEGEGAGTFAADSGVGTDRDSPSASASASALWFRRCRHVISENARVKKCVSSLQSSDWAEVGRLMNASHESLKDDFEVSCGELDLLVDITRKTEGVYGSRMTGGGFGGCTISLLEGDGKEAAILEYIREEYRKKSGGVDCKPFVVKRPGGGVREVDH